MSLSGVPDFFDRNKILSGGDLSHYQVRFIQNHSWFHAHDLKIIHICINTQWIFMFNVSISINFLWEIWLK